jgi:hypothetical protein
MSDSSRPRLARTAPESRIDPASVEQGRAVGGMAREPRLNNIAAMIEAAINAHHAEQDDQPLGERVGTTLEYLVRIHVPPSRGERPIVAPLIELHRAPELPLDAPAREGVTSAQT